ncbi:MAG: hypothetical protein JJU00_10010 [Opitutales bacterium]|nr:hypothetical protein [Opitutales bacterium]
MDTPACFPEWLRKTAIYQIFPASFQDSNGDGIGDLRGILSRLDYIRELGFETVWLSPIFESPFRDAGYDVSDYCKIAPRYGKMSDLEALLAGLHERGMRLLLDFVPGHTSIQHPWFTASSRHERSAYSDRYVWTDTTFYTGDKGTGPGQFINGHGERDGNYLANFFYFQPALNYGYADPDPGLPWQLPTDHPSVQSLRQEMFRILRFWLDKGVDGFRVDMAASLIKSNDPSMAREAMTGFWQEVRQWWDRDYPEAALIAEWSNPSRAIEAGFHIDFMIHFEEASYMKVFRGENKYTIFDRGDVSYFNPRGNGELQTFFRELQGHRAYIGNRGLISIPTGNHDLPRYSRDRSEAELKNILTFLFTLPSVPTLYYGDEIGMRSLEDLPSKEGAYRRTGARTPMQWDGTDGCGFSTAPEKDFYLPVDPSPERPSVARQLARGDSLLHHTKRLIALRKRYTELGSEAPLRQLNAPAAPYPVVYQREGHGSRTLIAVNPLNETKTAALTLPITVKKVLLGEARIKTTATTTEIELPPLASAILHLG